MPRTVRNAKIDTPSARVKLKKRREPYWTKLSKGRFVGYRKGARGGTWIARLRDANGEQHQHAIGAADDALEADGAAVRSYDQAQDAAREWFVAFAKEHEDGADADYTVAMAISDYLAWYRAHRKSYRDVELRSQAFILPKLGDVKLTDLRPRKIKQWLQALAATPPRMRTRKGGDQQYRSFDPGAPEDQRKRKHSANKVWTILRAALNQALEDGRVESDIGWRSVKPFKGVDEPRVRHLSSAERTRLVNASDPDFRQLVRAALLTGCRYGELSAMLVGDYLHEAQSVHVRESKSGWPRHVPLNDEGVDFFSRLVVGRAADERMFLHDYGTPWGQSHQGRRLAEAAKRAKVPDVSFHILRHSYGSELAMRGVPMTVIAAALGHRDTRTTEKHYAHLAPSFVADTIRENLPAIGGLAGDEVAALDHKR